MNQKQIDAIKKAYKEAEKRGDPVVAIAKAIASQIGITTLQGETLKTPIIDDEIRAVYGVPIPRDATFIIDPEGLARNIAMATKPAETFEGIEVKPERQVRADVTAHHFACKMCGSLDDKEGFELVPIPEGKDTHVFYCGNCSHYLWVVATPKTHTDKQKIQVVRP